MRSRLSKGYAAIAICAVAATLLAVSMIAPVISTSTDFSIYNSDWNGVSGLAVLTFRAGKLAPSFEVESTGTEISIANLNIRELDLDPATSALVIIGPSKSFSAEDGTIVGDFVKGGGRLLLADDFGTANSLLEGMNATSRFSNELVMDLAYEKQPEFSVCFDIRPDAVTDNVSTLLLNYPSSIVVNPVTTQVMAYSSVASWLDTNDDRDQEWGEPRGPFPLLARERLGNGEILLLSDPSVLINGMSGYMNNSALGSNLVAEISQDRSEVFFDESHREYFDPASIRMVLTDEISPGGRFLIVALVFVLTLWIATTVVEKLLVIAYAKIVAAVWKGADLLGLKFRRRAKTVAAEPLDIEQVVGDYIEMHPGWRAGILRYVLRESERHGKALDDRASRGRTPDAGAGGSARGNEASAE